jgi:hypothetical protein
MRRKKPPARNSRRLIAAIKTDGKQINFFQAVGLIRNLFCGIRRLIQPVLRNYPLCLLG